MNGAPFANPRCRDTVVLTRSSGDSFISESNFVDYTGMFVQHSHVLSREDPVLMSPIGVIP